MVGKKTWQLQCGQPRYSLTVALHLANFTITQLAKSQYTRATVPPFVGFSWTTPTHKLQSGTKQHAREESGKQACFEGASPNKV